MSGLKRYLMFISYVGSGYRGSQLQLLKKPNPSVITVQEVLEKGIQTEFKIEGERPVCVNFASRTDKGVHALRAAAAVALPSLENCFITPELLKYRLNKHFLESKSIRILEVYTVPDTFLFSKLEVEKTYLYRIGIPKIEFKKPGAKYNMPIFEIDRTFFVNCNRFFDLERAAEVVKLFEGIKDFGAVVGRPSKNVTPTVCNIKSFTIEQAQSFTPFDPFSQKFNFYHFICKGDRFLYCMVRRLVSLALEFSFGNLNIEDIKKLFDEPLPTSWPKRGVQIVPGIGLYLVNTNFNMEKFIQNENHIIEKSTVQDHLQNTENIKKLVE